jgi:hypothetical protein
MARNREGGSFDPSHGSEHLDSRPVPKMTRSGNMLRATAAGLGMMFGGQAAEAAHKHPQNLHETSKKPQDASKNVKEWLKAMGLEDVGVNYQTVADPSYPKARAEEYTITLGDPGHHRILILLPPGVHMDAEVFYPLLNFQLVNSNFLGDLDSTYKNDLFAKIRLARKVGMQKTESGKKAELQMPADRCNAWLKDLKYGSMVKAVPVAHKTNNHEAVFIVVIGNEKKHTLLESKGPQFTKKEFNGRIGWVISDLQIK